jgi:4'-phosphopantetheinyl transferase
MACTGGQVSGRLLVAARLPAYIRPTMSTGAGQQRAAGTDGCGWPIGPREPSLDEHDVHVWCVELVQAADDLLGLLNDRERERAERFATAELRARWARSRGALRALLGRYLQRDPRALEFDVGPHGKPDLSTADEAHGRLSFSLSHSEQLALYAFTASGSVGVDVQVALSAGADDTGRGERDHVALARRVFGEQQAQRLDAIAPERREREFLRLWTGYEAELKRRGRGIAAGTLAPAPAPWIAELDLGASAAAAVACETAPRQLRCWRWAA